MELKDTIELMCSENYEDRFIAEFWQTCIRHDKLLNMICKYEAGTLEFEPKCPIDILKRQKRIMFKYLLCLAMRAEIENVNLYKYEEGEI